jgi:hypothetical protein
MMARCENTATCQTGDDLTLLLRSGWMLSRLSRIVHRWGGRQFSLYLIEVEKEGRFLHLRIVDCPFIQGFAQTFSEKPIGWLNVEGFHPDDAIFETFYNAHPHA